MNEQLETAFEKIISDNPAPPTCPASSLLIENLVAHYANPAGYKAFTATPAELTGADWNDLTKPYTRRALMAYFEPLTADKMDKLQKLAAEHAATLIEQIKYSPTAANKAHMDQRADLHEAARDRSTEINSDVLHSRETIQASFTEKRTALNQRLELIVREAFPLCKEAILNIEDALKDEMRNIESGERELAAAYDLKWIPSSVWKACAVNLIVARKNILLFAGRGDQGPAQILEGFIKLN